MLAAERQIVSQMMRRVAQIGLFLVTASTLSTTNGHPLASRRVTFDGGEAVIESGGEKDHVVLKDTQGKQTSQSWCDPGKYDAYVALFKKLKETVGGGDRATVVKLVAYPLRVNGKRRLTLSSAAALSKAYDRVFTQSVMELIHKADPAAVFCRDGKGMLGDGVVWAVVSERTAKAVVVNE